MIEFILGAAVGAGAIMLKDSMSNEKSINSIKQSEANQLSAENDKLRRRNKELERNIEDLLMENKRLNKNVRETMDKDENSEDRIEDLLAELKRIKQQHLETQAQLDEYKVACKNYEQQISELRK